MSQKTKGKIQIHLKGSVITSEEFFTIQKARLLLQELANSEISAYILTSLPPISEPPPKIKKPKKAREEIESKENPVVF